MTAEQSIRNIERTMDAVNAAARNTPKPDPRADLVDLFERYAERGPGAHLYVEVETAADLVLDNDWHQGTGITGKDTALIRSIDIWTPALVRKYEDSAFNYMVELVRALEAARGVQS